MVRETFEDMSDLPLDPSLLSEGATGCVHRFYVKVPLGFKLRVGREWRDEIGLTPSLLSRVSFFFRTNYRLLNSLVYYLLFFRVRLFCVTLRVCHECEEIKFLPK